MKIFNMFPIPINPAFHPRMGGGVMPFKRPRLKETSEDDQPVNKRRKEAPPPESGRDFNRRIFTVHYQ